MSPDASVQRVEADLAALKAAAIRAGVALGCTFSSVDGFERNYPATSSRRQRRRPTLRRVVQTAILAMLLLMV
jgi:hypothetical protein